MHVIENSQLSTVGAGMSSTAKICLEDGALGAFGGAVIGGIISLPFAFYVANRSGVSGPHQLGAIILEGLGIGVGMALGGLIGTSTAMINVCQIDAH